MTQVPEVSARELADRLTADDQLQVLDVREGWELNLVALPEGSFRHLPLSQILTVGDQALSGLDGTTETVVVCHHGIRSAQVARWLIDLGWENVRHLRGGLDAYAREHDPSLGTY